MVDVTHGAVDAVGASDPADDDGLAHRLTRRAG